MVVYQAAPAYLKIQEIHQDVHSRMINEDEALEVFKEAAGLV